MLAVVEDLCTHLIAICLIFLPFLCYSFFVFAWDSSSPPSSPKPTHKKDVSAPSEPSAPLSLRVPSRDSDSSLLPGPTFSLPPRHPATQLAPLQAAPAPSSPSRSPSGPAQPAVPPVSAQTLPGHAAAAPRVSTPGLQSAAKSPEPKQDPQVKSPRPGHCTRCSSSRAASSAGTSAFRGPHAHPLGLPSDAHRHASRHASLAAAAALRRSAPHEQGMSLAAVGPLASQSSSAAAANEPAAPKPLPLFPLSSADGPVPWAARQQVTQVPAGLLLFQKDEDCGEDADADALLSPMARMRELARLATRELMDPQADDPRVYAPPLVARPDESPVETRAGAKARPPNPMSQMIEGPHGLVERRRRIGRMLGVTEDL